tara:strand:+ start:503 stop:730 length:228 start_codon:yes stop_codon:yes gene_type:complete
VRLRACSFGATATAEQDMHAPQRLGWRRLQETVAVLSRVQHAAACGSMNIVFPDGSTKEVEVLLHKAESEPSAGS